MQAKNTTDFWNAINRYKSARIIYTPNPITKDKWEEHYKSLFASSSPDLVDEETSHALVDNEMNDPISIEELGEALKKLSNGKAPGIDGIPNEVLKTTSLGNKNNMLQMLIQIFINDDIPVDWTKIVICPILKKGDNEQPSNYRPISLISTGLKLVTSILARRIQKWSDNNGVISDYQTGFRKNLGCQEQVFTLNTIIQSRLKNKGGRLFVAFLDIKAAFDSPIHKKLWERMRKLGIGEKIISFFRRLYNG